MDYYFSSANDEAALGMLNLPGGPVPSSPGVASAEAKDVIPCPHLEQLIASATGRPYPSLVSELRVLWPAPGQDETSFEPGTSITRLPDSLRDDLAEVQMTAGVAAAWAAELWGFDPAHAQDVGDRLVKLAQDARDQAKSLYWWSEM